MSQFHSRIKLEFDKRGASERKIIEEVWERRADYIRWPARARLLWPGCFRIKYHKIPDRIKARAKLTASAFPSEGIKHRIPRNI